MVMDEWGDQEERVMDEEVEEGNHGETSKIKSHLKSTMEP